MNDVEYKKFVSSLTTNDCTHVDDTLLHSVLGLQDEVGEITKLVKATMFYQQPLCYDELVRECGDLLFYLTMMCNVLGVTLTDVMKVNHAKLKVRYPNGFSIDNAAECNRDKEAERQAASDAIKNKTACSYNERGE